MFDRLAGLLRDCIARSTDRRVGVEDFPPGEYRVWINDRQHGQCIGAGHDMATAAENLLDFLRRMSANPATPRPADRDQPVNYPITDPAPDIVDDALTLGAIETALESPSPADDPPAPEFGGGGGFAGGGGGDDF